jgi:excisionase family DNA binding protein
MSERLAYTIAEAVEAAGVGKSTLYCAIQGGELTARKSGRRTLILAADLSGWLNGLPPRKATASAAAKHGVSAQAA